MKASHLNRISLILVAALHARSFAAGKEEVLTTPPKFLALPSEKDPSFLTMECEGKAPFVKIHCRFTEVDVTKPSEEEWLKSRAELEKDMAKRTENRLLQEFATSCKGLAQAEETLKQKIQTTGPYKADFAKKSLADFKELCACRDKACVVKAMLAQQDQEKRTCRVSSQTFEADFRKSGTRKWISNNGPEGLCDLVNVLVIEHEPDAAVLWTFTHTRAAGNTGAGPCKGFEINKPFVFTWRAPEQALMGCEVIKPAPF